MKILDPEQTKDEVILVARVLLVVLYLVFGWSKLTDFPGTVAYMEQVGAPLPWASACVAILVENLVSLAIVVGLWTRPLALILAVYTIATGFIGHAFWTMEGAERFEAAVNFYKNVSIAGGCLLLYAAGPGKYSLDSRLYPRSPAFLKA